MTNGLAARQPKTWVIVFLVLGVLGFADATFLTVEKLTHGPIPCLVTTGCDVVTNSVYATIGPVPISLLGAGYYLVIVVLSIMVLDTGQVRWLRILMLLTVVGFLFSLYLLWLQAFVLKAYCFYCLISAGISIFLFGTALAARRAWQSAPSESTKNRGTDVPAV
ncbi:MAG: vitamin K epoxide reductase family protein [Candidatus Kerfeldbacteria bacterium]|nr:vitamin K epoxide reductase family protein [Candidatus Kerfeldbacteria bacterium]